MPKRIQNKKTIQEEAAEWNSMTQWNKEEPTRIQRTQSTLRLRLALVSLQCRWVFFCVIGRYRRRNSKHLWIMKTNLNVWSIGIKATWWISQQRRSIGDHRNVHLAFYSSTAASMLLSENAVTMRALADFSRMYLVGWTMESPVSNSHAQNRVQLQVKVNEGQDENYF